MDSEEAKAILKYLNESADTGVWRLHSSGCFDHWDYDSGWRITERLDYEEISSRRKRVNSRGQ